MPGIWQAVNFASMLPNLQIQYNYKNLALETKHGVHLAYDSSYCHFSVIFVSCIYHLSFPHHLTSLWPPVGLHK